MNAEQALIVAGFAQKIGGLGLNAQFLRLTEGPVVTDYYFEIGFDMPISKMLNKSEDFALVAKAERVVIERRSGEVVISVPNKERKLIDFKDALHWAATVTVRQYELPIILGVNAVGEPAALDLTAMPHILLCGETGSGKSVFESAILCSLGVIKDPSELHIYLVDTKAVDLPLFEDLPHVKRVITDVRDFHKTCDFLMKEIRDRLERLRFAGARNIKEYNANGFGHMPYVLFMIDEFADLADADELLRKSDKKKDKEDREFEDIPTVKGWLKRIVQISRATGVHVIAGTQRSSVKVIDGDIKVNFPARIALRLTTTADSTTILGQGGAENLLGKGDMLVQRPEKATVERYHGPFVKLDDIQRCVLQNKEIRDSYRMMAQYANQN